MLICSKISVNITKGIPANSVSTSTKLRTNWAIFARQRVTLYNRAKKSNAKCGDVLKRNLIFYNCHYNDPRIFWPWDISVLEKVMFWIKKKFLRLRTRDGVWLKLWGEYWVTKQDKVWPPAPQKGRRTWGRPPTGPRASQPVRTGPESPSSWKEQRT